MKIKKLILSILVFTLLITNCSTVVLAAKKKSEANTYSAKDVKLLACLIYTEAGNQPKKGKIAVANVILNRVDSSKFSHANTIKEVIYDKKWCVQFGVTVGGKNSPLSKALRNYKELKSEDQMKKCIKAAKAALKGENVIGSRLYFTRYSNSLAKKHPNNVKIGAHIFY